MTLVKHRYLPLTEQDRAEMLEAIGVSSVDELFADIPASVRFAGTMDVSPALDEPSMLRHARQLAGKNADFDRYASFLGAGMYDHHLPVVINHVISRSEFYTAYTPYQPEISQGELQAIFEFQSYICELTGMAVANASMYDGPTALAEAGALAANATGRKKLLVSRAVHPEARAIMRTTARGLNLDVVEIGTRDGVTDLDAIAAHAEGAAAVLLQTPNFFGCLEDVAAAEKLAHAAGGLLVVSANPLALGLVEAPGKLGADIVVGDCQPLGIPASLGGPSCGYFAVADKWMRRMPGRIVGQTVDRSGKRGFVLTLQAREQHIRREKATSNICSNQALLALCASVYLSTMGKAGLQEVAMLNVRKAHYAAQTLIGTDSHGHGDGGIGGSRVTGSADRNASSPNNNGSSESSGGNASGIASSASSTANAGKLRLAFPNAPFFNEFVVKLPDGADPKVLNAKLLEAGFIGGYDLGRDYPELAGHLLVAVTEQRTRAEIDQFANVLEELA